MTTINSNELTTSLLGSFGLSPTARTDQTRFNTTGTVQNTEKLVAQNLFDTKADISDGAWLMLRDTVASGVSQISLVQLAQDAISGLLDKATTMRDAMASLEGLEPGSDAWQEASDRVTEIESDISKYIARNLTARSASVTVDASEDYGAETTINYLETLRLDGTDSSISDLAIIEINSNDFMNAFHDPGSCPICQANQVGSPNQSTPFAEAANYLSGSGSTTTDITAPGQLTANTDTNTIIMGPYWDDSSLSYSIYNQNNPVPYNYSQNPSTVAGAATANNNMWDYRSNVQAMFTAIEDSSALTFEEIVEDPATGTVGDLRMAFSDGFAGDGAGSAGAFAFAPSTDSPIAGDIWWNDSDPDNFDLSTGTKGFQRGLHEIGHALGLSHPHDSGSYDNSTLAGIGASIKDNYRYTLMSYNQGGTGTSYYYDRNMVVDFTVTNYNTATNFASITYTASRAMPSTMMILDVEALEHLYGASTANATDTTHDVAAYGDEFIRTITDSGGTDSIDASRTTRSNTINLEAGSLSSINIKTQANLVTEIEDAIIAAAAAAGTTLARTDSAVQDRISYFENTWLAAQNANAQPTTGGTALYTGADNLAIARSATIENAVGGSANDTITGNSSNNEITGGSGDDTLNGGAGEDTAIYSGEFASYTITDNGDGTHTVADSTSNRDGSDTISNIEKLRFSDVIYTISTGGVVSTGGTQGGSSGNINYFGQQAAKLGLVADELAPPHDFLALSEISLQKPATAVDVIDQAIETLTNERAKLGAITNAISAKQSLMLTQVVNLKDAQSRIVDTDFAQTMQTLIKGQVIQQAGLALLSVTNMSSDLAMRLLRP